jgi:hypothetical protein
MSPHQPSDKNDSGAFGHFYSHGIRFLKSVWQSHFNCGKQCRQDGQRETICLRPIVAGIYAKNQFVALLFTYKVRNATFQRD